MLESGIQHQIRKALGLHPRVVLWRNNVGVAQVVQESGLATIRYGLCVGSSDLVGIINVGPMDAPVGIFFGLEVKTRRGRQREEQVLFEGVVRRFGGEYLVARSAAEALAAIDKILEKYHNLR